MVNTGGRSRGCTACRRGRVKCDEHKPSCRRCIRLGLECDGPKDITFIHTSTTPDTRPADHDPSSGSNSSVVPSFQLTSPPTPVGLEVYISYTQTHLQRNGLIATAITEMRLHSNNIESQSFPISHQTIISFATIMFGMQHRQPDITRQGCIMYSAALKQLNHLLSLNTTQTSDEVVLAVAALAISECLVPSGRRSCLEHMMGLQKLMQLRDPGTFWSLRSRGFCEGVRFLVVFGSLQCKTPCILARSDWRESLRVICPPELLQVQELWDILASCSVLIARRESIMSTLEPSNREQWEDIRRHGSLLLERVYALRETEPHFHTQQDEPRFCGPGRESTPGSTAEPEVDQVMLYNTALIEVLQFLSPISLAGNTSEKTLWAEEMRLAAIQSCQVIRNYLSNKRFIDASFPPLIHMSLAAAWNHLRYDESDEGIWLRELLTEKGRQVVANGLWATYQWLNSLSESD